MSNNFDASQIANYLTDPFISPATLAMQLWGEGPDMWIPQKHLVYASHRIANCILRGDGRLIISMPPRHGKSRLISETTIPWFLEKFPGKNIMFIAYNGDFAEEWGGKAKDIISNRDDLFSYSIRSDRSRVDRFETTKGNTCWFAGINGGQTGKGAHLVIIDDYIKDIEQAASPTERQKMWDKFVANIWTRLEPGATIIILATRWWSDDLIGRILKHLNGWEYISFPGIYYPTKIDAKGNKYADMEAVDILGRKYGDVLFPERYPIERLRELQSAMNVSSSIFEALIQQTPVDQQTEFANSEWLQVAFNIRPDNFRMVRAWDFAATQGGGDYTTGIKMGRIGTSRQAYIFNTIREQLSPLKVEELIRATAVSDGIDCEILLEQEPGSSGQHLFEHYRNNVLPEFKVKSVSPGNKKNAKFLKAQPLVACAQSGNLFLVDNSGRSSGSEELSWIKAFRDEFGNCGPAESSNNYHDDQLDTASMAFNHLFAGESISVSWGNDSVGGRVINSHLKINSALDSIYGTTTDGAKLITGCTW